MRANLLKTKLKSRSRRRRRFCFRVVLFLTRMIRRRFFFLAWQKFFWKTRDRIGRIGPHKHYRSLIKMSCCGVCGDSVGPTSQARKEHAAREHGYPDCDTCGRIIRNLRMFEAHARTPHRKTKCLIHTCDELVLVGKELEHGRTAHGFPNCSCGKTINLNFGNFVQHVNSHSSLKAPKIKRRRQRRPLLQPREHVQTTTAAASSPTPTAVDPSLLDDAVDAYADIVYYESLMERDDATTTTIPAATEGDPLRLLDAVYYDDDNDESM